MPQNQTSGMSVAQGAALTIGAVLGTGVISLPAMAAGIAGPASILAWLALVVLSAPLALTFAALGARFPDAGGVSTYARRAFGSRAATAVGWLLLRRRRRGRSARGRLRRRLRGRSGRRVADHDDVGGRRHHRRRRGAQLVRAPDLRPGPAGDGHPAGGAADRRHAWPRFRTPTSSHLTPFAPNGWGADRLRPPRVRRLGVRRLGGGHLADRGLPQPGARRRRGQRSSRSSCRRPLPRRRVRHGIARARPGSRGQPGTAGRAPRRRLRRAGPRHHRRWSPCC